MQILVNTSNGIENKETLERWATAEITQVLARFALEVTRVEVHLSDENADKSGAGDKRCLMEARLANKPPVAVKHHAPTMDAAFRGAAEKLKNLLDSAVGRTANHRDRETIRKEDAA